MYLGVVWAAGGGGWGCTSDAPGKHAPDPRVPADSSTGRKGDCRGASPGGTHPPHPPTGTIRLCSDCTFRLHSVFLLPEQLAVQGCSAFSGSIRESSVSCSKLHASFPGEPLHPGGQSSASLILYARGCQHPTSPPLPPLPAQGSKISVLSPVASSLCHLPLTSVLGLGSNRFPRQWQSDQYRGVSGY